MADETLFLPPPWRPGEVNPYRQALEDLLVRMGKGGGPLGVGQRRGVRRALAEVDRVWEAQQGVRP